VTERLRVGVNYSFLWRDENYYDQLENQYIPAKTKHSVGASARYIVTETSNIEFRGAYSWIEQDPSAILQATVTPPTFAAIPPQLNYTAWMVSTAANFRF